MKWTRSEWRPAWCWERGGSANCRRQALSRWGVGRAGRLAILYLTNPPTMG